MADDRWLRTLRGPVLGLASALLLFAGWGGGCCAGAPNIVLILCDDMGWSDLGCYGGEVETPNLDRLAGQGMRFTQFYNNAKCTTTRASLITGLYPRPDGQRLLHRNMVTLGEVMADAGYRTALCGKWHLGRSPSEHPSDRGFQEYYGLLDGACNFFDPSIADPPYKGGGTRYFAHNHQRITSFPEDFYTTDAFTDHAIATVRRFAEGDAPFFLHLCYNAPHYPLHAPPEDIAKYRGRFLDGWDTMRERRFARQKELGLTDDAWRLSGRDSQAYDWETADHQFEDLRMAVYAAMIDRMDQNIGRLLATLDELGETDNTLILFLADNGGCAEEPGGRDPALRHPGPKDDYVAVGPAWGWAQNAPFRRYKVWMHEGGICTPLIVKWPGQVAEGAITSQPAHIIDLLPTCLDVAGGAYPAERHGHTILPVEGKSLAPIFAGEQRTPHDQLCWSFAGNAAIRQGDWKLVFDKLTKAWELFDLSSDRTEMNNLASGAPGRAARMAADYNAWAAATGNQKHPGPKPAPAGAAADR
ncbi:Arylsulfatase [Pirellulimonas nuda]|uniref:Arylsulfatase n=1 Tax=Pirellulimonas nuda TaxID=2528009 RepID=A0A518DI09_9BACT|nr:arylsulfatase [Pirellulimonas nuda]QDU91118.1 Arylsulfatase [Pirellulimonas nuda]